MDDTPTPLQRFHSLSTNNREMLQVAGSGICFHCGEDVDFVQVEEWVDQGQTAVCPFCHVDAVLPDVTNALIRALQIHYFNAR